MVGLSLASISSTFWELTPTSSASCIPQTTQRTTSFHLLSPWAVSGPRGSFDIVTSRMTCSSGSAMAVRSAANCDLSDVCPSQRPSS